MKAYKQYFKWVLPIVLLIAICEDAANPISPRRGLWKAQLHLPDLADYMMFEVANVEANQKKDGDELRNKKRKAVAERKKLAKENRNATTTATKELPAGQETQDTEEEEKDDGNDLYEEAEEEDGDEERLSQKEQDERAKYWERLKPYYYKNATEAASITFKQFMSTHIRFYLPGVFRKLVVDSEAVKKWSDLKYLMDNLQES